MSSQGITYLIDAQDRASGKIRKHRQEIKALAADAKRKESATIQAGQSVIESTKTELEVIREKIDAVRAYAKTSGKAFNESRESLSRLLAQHKAEKAAIEDKAAAEAKSANNQSALSAAAAMGVVGGAAGEAASSVSFLISEIDNIKEVSTSSGKGVLLMQAGIAAVVFTLGYKLGGAIGNAIFQTEKWRQKNAVAMEELREGAARAARSVSRSFERNKALADTIVDPGERENKLAEMLKRAGKEAEATGKRVDFLKKRIEEMQEDSILLFQSENHKAEIETQKGLLQQAKSNLEAYQSQKQELEDQLLPAGKALRLAQQRAEAEKQSTDALAALRQELEVAKATGDKRLEIEARIAGVSDDQLKNAVAMRKELNAIAEAERAKEEAKAEANRKEARRLADIESARKKAEADRKRAADQRIREAQKIADFQKTTIDNIKLQLVEYAKGKEVASALRLEQSGFAREEAIAIARFKEQIEKLNTAKNAAASPAPENTAKDERLATGRAAASFRKTAAVAEAEKQTRIQTELRDVMRDLLAFEQSRVQAQPIKVLGR